MRRRVPTVPDLPRRGLRPEDPQGRQQGAEAVLALPRQRTRGLDETRQGVAGRVTAGRAGARWGTARLGVLWHGTGRADGRTGVRLPGAHAWTGPAWQARAGCGMAGRGKGAATPRLGVVCKARAGCGGCWARPGAARCGQAGRGTGEARRAKAWSGEPRLAETGRGSGTARCGQVRRGKAAIGRGPGISQGPNNQESTHG